MIYAFWYALFVPLCGVTIIGALSGLIGTFAFLNQETMLGDAVAHAAFPGIVCMFICTHTSNPLVLMGGGLLSGLCAVFSVHFLTRVTPIGRDALLGIMLSVCFGIGLVLLTHVQKGALSEQSVLNKFLFGSAATLLYNDLLIVCLLACILVTICFACWKEFLLLIFDPAYARSCGYPVTLLYITLYSIIVMTIVLGLYAVGVILTSSLLVAPAVTARQCTQSAYAMACVAAACGSLAGISGVLVSMMSVHMPTGPVIVLIATVTALSALYCKKRYERMI